MKKILAITTIFVGFFAFGLITPAIAGLGVSPATIESVRLKPGSSFSQEIVISQSNPEQDLQVTLEPDLEIANDWIQFEPGQNFTIPSGTERFIARVILNVPATADINDYSGFLRVKAVKAQDAVDNGVSVVQGARIDMNIATSEEDYTELLVRAIETKDVEQDGELKVNLKIENKGNVASSPTKVDLDVKDLNQTPIKTFTDNTIDLVGAGETKVVIANFQLTDIEPGEYFGTAKVYFGDEILREEDLVFNVVEFIQDVEVSDSSDLNEFVDSNRTFLVIFGVILIGLIILGAPYVYLRQINDFSSNKSKIIIGLSFVLFILVSIAFVMLINEDEDNTNTANLNVNNIAAEPVASNTSLSVISGAITEARVLGDNNVNIPADSYRKVYSEPDFSSNVIYEAQDGENFDVISNKTESGWFNVSLSDGQNGWLHESSVNSITTVEL